MNERPPSSLYKNKGKWYVNLTIPKELRVHFKNRRQLSKSTGTADKATATKLQHSVAQALYDKLDAVTPNKNVEMLERIASMMSVPRDIEDTLAFGEDLLPEQIDRLASFTEVLADTEEPHFDLEEALGVEENQVKLSALGVQLRALQKSQFNELKLSDVASDYFDTNPYDKHKTLNDAKLAIKNFVDFSDDVLLSDINPVILHSFSEHMAEVNKSSRETIAKKIGYLSRLLGHAERKGIVPINPMGSFKLAPRVGAPRTSYIPFEHSELTEIFQQRMPEHVRLLLSILLTTGMRLDEAALLEFENVKTDENGIAFFDLTDSVVKNLGSQRKVPIPLLLNELPGADGPLFPQFNRDADGKAQAPASKACMKIIRKVTSNRQKVVHSFRGNLKDLLRNAGVSKEINDFITGHSSGDVAGTYGSGPSLQIRADALNSVSHPWLE